MGLAQTPSPPDYPPYPQELQIKLYQLFTFPVSILFCIILFLLFYLFYLKRSSSMLSSPPPILPGSLHDASSFPPMNLGLKGDMIKKLCIVLDDEDLRQKNLQYCVCLGEFEMEEELQQVPSFKHVFPRGLHRPLAPFQPHLPTLPVLHPPPTSRNLPSTAAAACSTSARARKRVMCQVWLNHLR